MTPFYERMPDVGGFGIERNIDIIGAALAAGALGGVAAHAVATGVHQVRQRKVVHELPVLPNQGPGDQPPGSREN
jgi:Ni,Fe-hydrogenase I small subunit